MTDNYIRRYMRSLLVVAVAALLSACTSNGETVSATDERPLAVSFDTYMQQQRTTRGTYPTDIPTKDMDNDELREWGFGVFAHHSGNDEYKRNETYNFMFNQRVEAAGTDDWTYSPVKYWPNDNQPADDQENDSGNDPAWGSQKHSYVHFFAYAPYCQYDVVSNDIVYLGKRYENGNPNPNESYGITDMPGNGSEAYLIYHSSLVPGADLDLLWAKQDYLYKTKPSGEGYTSGKVHFEFQHALTRMNIVVLGLFDRVTTGDDAFDGYKNNVADSTRILIDEVTISRSVIPDHGRMYLAPKKSVADADYDRDATAPYWEPYDLMPIYVKASDKNINERLIFKNKPNDEATAEDALTELAKLPLGVDEVERPLYAKEVEKDGKMVLQPLYYMFPPNTNLKSCVDYLKNKGYSENQLVKDYGPLSVTVKYHVITYDPLLTLNSPKYFSIVENDITATFDGDFTFDANREYTLRLLLGLTSVKFEVVDITDWENPIVLDAVVKEWEDKTKEYDVE